MGTWDGRADWCAAHRRPLGRGQARYRQALPGGQATHDTIEAPTSAVLRRGGRLPPAAGSPAARRATRDLRRRRRHLRRHRAARFSPVHHPTRQAHRPPLGQTIASKAQRTGGADRCGAPAGQHRMAIARARSGDDEAVRRALDRASVKAARPHDANPRDRLRPVPGLGTMLRRVWLDDLHARARVPRGPAVAAYGRRVTWAQASAGTRSGTAGTTRGQAQLTGAFSAAAVVCWREHPAGPNVLTRRENQPRTGHALTRLAHHVARAVDDLCQRTPAGDRHHCLHASGRGVGALHAALESRGMRRLRNARPGVNPCVCQRPCASRACALRPRGEATSTPAPAGLAHMVTGLCGRRRTRACTARANVARFSWRGPRTARGPRAVSRSHRPPWTRSAIAVPRALEPPDGCGAATCVHQPVAIQSGHAAEGPQCPPPPGGNKSTAADGIRVTRDHWGLIRVKRVGVHRRRSRSYLRKLERFRSPWRSPPRKP
jgi:hypothetical protein